MGPCPPRFTSGEGASSSVSVWFLPGLPLWSCTECSSSWMAYSTAIQAVLTGSQGFNQPGHKSPLLSLAQLSDPVTAIYSFHTEFLDR